MDKVIPKRICFYGGPGVGKSTIGARLFADIKQTKIRVEYAIEHVKNWTFINRHIDKWDQPYLLGRQIQYSHYPLQSGADLVIEESPPELNSWYANYFGMTSSRKLMDVAWEYSMVYPTLHVLLIREDSFYDSFGRFQEIDDAKRIDTAVKEMLEERTNGKYWVVNPMDYDKFLKDIKHELRLNNGIV